MWTTPAPSEPLPSPYGLLEASPSPYPQSPWRRPLDGRSDGLHEGWGGAADGAAGAGPAAGAASPYAATDAANDAPTPPTNPHDAAATPTDGVTDGLARDAMAALWTRARTAVAEPAARDAWVRQKRKEMLRNLMTEDESARWNPK